MPTAPTPIDALPTAPTQADRATFAARAESFAAAQATFRTQTNAIATNAYNNAVGAAASATAAASSASSASGSATAAANSASSASTHNNNAATSASTASTKASEASASATAAAGSATTAGTHATNAGNSATAAAGSATAAAGSATSAASAAAVGRASGNGVNLTLDLSATTDADPGAGKVRPNNAALTSATFLYLDDADNYGNAIGAWADTFDDSTNAVKGQLILKNSANDALAIFNVTGSVVVGTGYRKIPVSYVGGSGTFANNAILGFSFARVGNAGANGLDGAVSLDYAAPSGATSFAAADKAKIFKATGTWTLGSASAATLGAGWFAFFENAGTGVITGPVSSELINPGDVLLYFSDGTTLRYTTLRRGQRWKFSTTSVTTGTAVVVSLSQSSEVVVEVEGLSHSGGSAAQLITQASFDGGSSFPTGLLGASSVTSSENVWGLMFILNRQGGKQITIGVPGFANGNPTVTIALPQASNSYGVTQWRGPNGNTPMTHLRFTWSAGHSFDAGQIIVWAE